MNMIGNQQRVPLSEYAQQSKPVSNTGCMIGLILLTLLPFACEGGMHVIIPGAFAISDSTTNLTLLIVGLIYLLLPSWLIWITARGSYLKKGATKLWLERNDLDFAMSKTIQARLDALLSSPLSIVNRSDYYQNLRIGEMSRHFDSQTKAIITGWLDHQFAIEGKGIGLQVGNVGLGVGKVGITGQSQANFGLSATTRDNLLGNGFIAVLERDMYGGLVDTVRVVVPSEPAIREFVEQFMDGLSAIFYRTSYCGNVFSAYTASLQQLIEISYVSDLLSACLRMPPARRPRVSVIGEKINEHAIIGDMILFENEGRWHTLFPTHLLREINGIAIQARDKVDLPDPTVSRTGVADVKSRG